MPARASPPAGKESCAEGVNQSASVFWGYRPSAKNIGNGRCSEEIVIVL